MADHNDAREAVETLLRSLKVEEPERIATHIVFELGQRQMLGDTRYLRWCEWPGCLRSFHVLSGPDPEIDGRGWVYSKNRNLFCPGHATTGHMPERPDWKPGDEVMTARCECGAHKLTRPTSLSAANDWWREHVRQVSRG